MVIYKVNFKEELVIDVDCFILIDKAKTAVISQRVMVAALILAGPELIEKIEKTLIFQAL